MIGSRPCPEWTYVIMIPLNKSVLFDDEAKFLTGMGFDGGAVAMIRVTLLSSTRFFVCFDPLGACLGYAPDHVFALVHAPHRRVV